MAKKNGAKKKAGNGASKSTPVKIIKTFKTLRVGLTDAEIKDRAQLAASKVAQRDSLDAERKAHSADLGGKIKTLDTEHRTLSGQVRDGYEYRSVECETRFIYRTGNVEVYRKDTGEKIEERAMIPEERQPELPLEGSDVIDAEFDEAALGTGGEDSAAPPAEAAPKRRARKPRSTTSQAEAAPAE